MQMIKETLRRLSWVLLLLVLTFLIPIINIAFVCSNDSGIDVGINICSIVCSASAAASCSTKFFGKNYKCIPVFVIISLVVSSTVFVACLTYQYTKILILNINLITFLTVCACFLAVIVVAYFIFKENPLPISPDETAAAADLANGPDNPDDEMNLTKKGGK